MRCLAVILFALLLCAVPVLAGTDHGNDRPGWYLNPGFYVPISAGLFEGGQKMAAAGLGYQWEHGWSLAGQIAYLEGQHLAGTFTGKWMHQEAIVPIEQKKKVGVIFTLTIPLR